MKNKNKFPNYRWRLGDRPDGYRVRKVDEKICDGYYYASSIRLFYKVLNNPEQLLSPPETIVLDPGVGKRKWRKEIKRKK